MIFLLHEGNSRKSVSKYYLKKYARGARNFQEEDFCVTHLAHSALREAASDILMTLAFATDNSTDCSDSCGAGSHLPASEEVVWNRSLTKRDAG